MSNFVRDYFSNSYQKMVSFFAREDSITIKEIEDIMEMMKKSGISNTYGDDRSS